MISLHATPHILTDSNGHRAGWFWSVCWSHRDSKDATNTSDQRCDSDLEIKSCLKAADGRQLPPAKNLLGQNMSDQVSDLRSESTLKDPTTSDRISLPALYANKPVWHWDRPTQRQKVIKLRHLLRESGDVVGWISGASHLWSDLLGTANRLCRCMLTQLDKRNYIKP